MVWKSWFEFSDWIPDQVWNDIMHPPVAQSVEQLPFKEMVVGSIPTGRTEQIYENHHFEFGGFLLLCPSRSVRMYGDTSVKREAGSRDFSVEKYL